VILQSRRDDLATSIEPCGRQLRHEKSQKKLLQATGEPFRPSACFGRFASGCAPVCSSAPELALRLRQGRWSTSNLVWLSFANSLISQPRHFRHKNGRLWSGRQPSPQSSTSSSRFCNGPGRSAIAGASRPGPLQYRP